MVNMRRLICACILVVHFAPSAFADKVSERVARAEAQYAEAIRRAKSKLAMAYETALERRTKQGNLDDALHYRAKLHSLNTPGPEPQESVIRKAEPNHCEHCRPSHSDEAENSPVSDVKHIELDGIVYVQGLGITEYPMQKNQEKDGAFIALIDLLDTELLRSDESASTSDWRFNENRNAVAAGYLLIEEPGEYAFISDNFYDRNALYVMSNSTPVCSYQDTSYARRIRIDKPGMIPLWSVGYAHARGTVNVKWKPPGQSEFSAVPTHRLFRKVPSKVQ